MSATPEISGTSRRIARNTLVLYIRMFVLMLVGFYTSRVVLRDLGVTDFGIYSAVGGVVSLFAVLTTALTSSISRFLTYGLGEGDMQRLNRIFSTSVTLQILLAAVIVLLSEPSGIWFLKAKMVIPPDRMQAAFWVLQFSIASFIVQLISVPYNSLVVAHEHMGAYAWISIFEGVGKLCLALLIARSPVDRLIFYAAGMLAVSFLVRLAYGIYCRVRFAECRYRPVLDKPLFKEMFAFAGWSALGSSANILRDHGANLLLNVFFGPAVNAARGLSMQVSGYVQKFVTSFVTAVNPQITKSYAAGDRSYMMTLTWRGSRLAFQLLLLLAYPVLFYAPFLLGVWLKDVPEYTVLFIRLVIVLSLVESISYTLATAAAATGRIRNYQLVIGGLQLLNLPVDYLLLKLGCAPEVVFTVAIAIALCCLVARLFLLRSMVGLKIGEFCREVLLRDLLVALIGAVLPALMVLFAPEGTLWALAGCTLAVLGVLTAIYAVGLSRGEREFVKLQLHKWTRKE